MVNRQQRKYDIIDEVSHKPKSLEPGSIASKYMGQNWPNAETFQYMRITRAVIHPTAADAASISKLGTV
jgi:hypothetical protein